MAHVRIDEGVKRGPRKRKKDGTWDMRTIPRGGRPARYQHKVGEVTYGKRSQPIPADLDAHAVLDEYVAHGSTRPIAERLGIARDTLTAWLRKTVPQEWKEIQIARALVRKEDSDDGLSSAPDALSLARARELLKSAQFDLTALDPEYQPKQHVTVDINVDLGDRLMRAEQRVIEGEYTQDSPASITIPSQSDTK